MILVKCNCMEYEYDLNALLHSFFPQRELRFALPDEKVSEDSTIIYESEIRIMLEDNIATIQIKKAEEPVFTTTSKELSLTNRKNEFKLLLYDVLAEYTGETLPWGNLTGIRPTKLVMQLIEDNILEEEIYNTLYREHRVSREKVALSIDIAHREREILSLPGIEGGYSLYLGIPFCPTTCLYCSFTSFPIEKWEKRVWEYLFAMEKEMDFWAERYKDKVLSSVYVGGGTPTTLSAEQMDWLLTKIKEKFPFEHVLEFTVEAGRADSITEDKLKAMYRNGVSRISVNPQTMNDETLKLIGRQHTVSDVKKAFYMAREIGFTNINMDIILGLPGEEEKEVRHTMEELKLLKPDSLTVHSLAIKRASRLNRVIAEQGIQRLMNTDATMNIAREAAASMNMQSYYLYRQKNMAGNFENVGYSTSGKYGIYNILIMEEKQSIIAIGAGSITKIVFPGGRMERCDNVKDVGLYISQIEDALVKKNEFLQSQR